MPETEVHIKQDAWTEATLCGGIATYAMRQQWLAGERPSCTKCLKAFLKQRDINLSQRRWAEGLLKRATA